MLYHIEDNERRCPRLGSVISFSYCMISGNDGGVPCFKILDCWWESFDIQTYLKEQMTEPSYQRFMRSVQTPQSKISSIVEIAKNAGRRKTDR